MRAPTGNLATVYAEFWRMQEIADEVEPEINQVVRASASMEAEISEGASADWFLVYAYPGDDARAMRHLARRRFGVFRPMQQRYLNRNSAQRVQGWEPVFPGWLFVYCWEMRKLQHRVRQCPGIMSILCDPVSMQPYPIPDEFVQEIRHASWVYDDHAPIRTNFTVAAVRHRRRRRRSGKRLRKGNHAIVAKSFAEAFAGSEAMTGEQHNSILLNNLGGVRG